MGGVELGIIYPSDCLEVLKEVKDRVTYYVVPRKISDAQFKNEGMSLRAQTKERIFEKLIRNSLQTKKKSLEARGKLEKEIIMNVHNVIGRTDIDHMMVTTQNPSIKYFYCNEILRDVFYHGERWNLDKIEAHSLFFRNTGNPIKGFLGMLKVLAILTEKYPNVKLYVVGPAVYKPSNIKQRFIEGTYNLECRKIMDKYNLWNYIEFLKPLNSQ